MSTPENQPAADPSQQPAVPAPPAAQQYPARPSPVYPAQPPSAYPAQPPAAYPAQPSAVYPAQPSSAYAGQPSAAYPAQPSPAYPAQPSAAYPAQAPAAGPFAAPYAPPAPGFGAVLDAPAQQRSKALGRTAFVLGLIAAVIAPVLIGIGYGRIAPALLDSIDRGSDPTADLLWLAPVAGWELLAELALYAGTLAGVAAIVAGLIAAVQRRGRAWGVWAIVLGVLGPIVVGVIAFAITLGALAAYV